MCSVWPHEVELELRARSISTEREGLSTDGRGCFSQVTSSSLEMFKGRPAEHMTGILKCNSPFYGL